MPPKKRRGGARGRRGRPPKKGAQPETELTATHSPQDSPIFEQTETSSSNSSALEEPAPETKVKLETKIHKKFGIKYHVPDEVGKSLSPQLHVEEAASPATDKHEVPTSEESSSAVENESDEKMHTEPAEDIQECLEDEITEQMHQLGVTGTIEETCVIDNVAAIQIQMQEDEATVIEYETECDQESEIIEGEVAVEGESFQEVYYVIEETNESIPEEHEHEHDDTVNIPEENVTHEPLEIKMEVENVPEEPEKAKERKKDEVKQKDPKIPEKPCRKSKRLSLKSNKLAEVQETSVKPQISPKEEKDDVKEESEVMQEVSSTIENECKPENEIKIEEIAKTSPTEDIDSIDETINEVIEASDIEPEIKTKKKAAEKKKIVKTKKKDLKDKDKDQEVETPQTEKKKSKKVTFKTQPKGKKGLKSPQQTPDKKFDEEDNNIRRSSRIKTISTQKVRSRGKGLVKKDDILESHSKSTPDDKIFIAPTSTTDVEHHKPVKVKSRWRRSSELEMRDIVKTPLTDSPVNEKDIEKKKNDSSEVERRSKQFHHLKENVYLTERISCKEAKKMLCDCFLTEEEIAQGEYGCGDDCLNRLLMIECGNLCTVGERCTNKRFQKMQGATIEAFATEKKGLGIRAVANIPSGDFILEYVGEVLDAERFEQRAAEYSKDKNQHYYFMALRADAVIDATMKGNISRFINHSCEPNAETQKWTVNGELRIGFFSKRTILAGEEITFDYQFQRYGKEAQKCFCEAPSCRGWLGEEPDSDEESEEDEDEEDEEEDEEEEEEVKDEVTEETKEEKSEEKPGAEEAEIKVPPVVKSPKKPKPPKKERKLRELKPRRKPRLDRFEDLGLDEEIESLQSTGLKNQAQTLKLSRLMVRAKEPVQRTKLLKLLKKGEFPCRRLFLDYHGLKLIHGWMTDAQHLARKDPSMESLRLEILQTLAMLPIPNKTMLQDSKVLPTVEKWSKDSEDQESPADSDSNSPKDTEQSSQEDKEDKKISVSSEDSTRHTAKHLEYSKKSKDTKIATPVKIVDDDEVRKSTGMECGYCKLIPDYNVGIKDELMIIFDDDFVPLEVPVKVAKHVEPEPKYDFRVEVIALALKLLEEWASLKEVFRIPKKERIEQMKEHEREADRRYKALTVEQETERKRDRYRGFQRLSRIEITDRLNKDRDRERDIRDRSKNDRYNHIQVPMSKMSKHERRELFARQAQEEERRRKQEMWSKQNWMVMGQDPRLQNFDPTRNMQLMWNPQIAQYQNIVADPSMTSFNYPPGMFRPGLPGPPAHMETPHGIQSLPSGMMPPTLPPGQPNLATLPPMTTMPPNMARPLPFAENDPSKVQFMGPIPPPVVLPAKWKCAKDIYGRPYYYHIRMRKAQWEPPDVTSSRLDEEGEEEEEESESSSSSDTSSLTSTSSSEDSDSEDDTRLMMDIRNKFRRLEQQKLEAIAAAKRAAEDVSQPLMGTDEAVSNLLTLSDSMLPTDDMNISDLSVMTEMMDRSMAEEAASPLEAQFLLGPPAKKRRVGLVQEHIISPRSEEDRLQFREDVKKYKLNKEMVRKQKDILLQQSKKQIRQGAPPPAHPPTNGDKHAKQHKRKVSTKTKLKEMEANANTEETKKIKEAFRTAMATVMVSILNPYRKSDCKEGRITATEDFKHLARKLTHFVMLKELKHCDRIEELDCTDSVKAKAKEFVRKYMAKFGEVYKRPVDETDHLN